jgi:hypothetical protein
MYMLLTGRFITAADALRIENASVSKQRCAGLSAGSAIRRHKFTRPLGRTSSPLRSGLSFRYAQVAKPTMRFVGVMNRSPPILRGFGFRSNEYGFNC